MKKFLSYLLPVLLCIAMGWIASLLQTSALIEWYPTLNHSPLSPPAYIFPIAWAILYVLMGLSIGSLISRGDMSLVKLWLFQLLVNFLWSITFFALRSPFATRRCSPDLYYICLCSPSIGSMALYPLLPMVIVCHLPIGIYLHQQF